MTVSCLEPNVVLRCELVPGGIQTTAATHEQVVVRSAINCSACRTSRAQNDDQDKLSVWNFLTVNERYLNVKPKNTYNDAS